MKGISIVVPVFNSGEYLEELMLSIKTLNIKNCYEVLFVDDGSTDFLTRNILEKLKKDNRVRVVYLDKNYGVQKARSVGLLNSKFDFLTTIDSDDRYYTYNLKKFKSNYLDDSIEILLNKQNIVFCHGYSFMFGEEEGYTISSYPLTWELILKKHHVPTFIVYRKKDLNLKILYDEKILKWQDWSFGVSLLSNRFKEGKTNEIYCFGEVVHNYRIHRKFERISQKKISEMTMIEFTYNSNKKIFKNFYKEDEKRIAHTILKNKPDRLEELLYVSRNNLDIALEIKNTRNYSVRNKVTSVP